MKFVYKFHHGHIVALTIVDRHVRKDCSTIATQHAVDAVDHNLDSLIVRSGYDQRVATGFPKFVRCLLKERHICATGQRWLPGFGSDQIVELNCYSAFL